MQLWYETHYVLNQFKNGLRPYYHSITINYDFSFEKFFKQQRGTLILCVFFLTISKGNAQKIKI